MKHYALRHWIIAGIILLLFTVPVSGAAFTANGGSGCAPASSPLSVPVTLNDIPTGLSGLNVTFAISDPQAAQIVGIAYPDWAKMHDSSPLPAQQVWVRMVDLGKKVNANDRDVPVATLSVQGLKAGSVVLTITPTRVEDDAGKVYSVAPRSQTLCFTGSAGSFPTAASPQSAATALPGTSPASNGPRTTYSPLPIFLPVCCCILAVIAIHRMRRTRRE
jgi:hypothetical protein